MEIEKELDLDSFIKKKLSSNKKGKGFNLPLYKNEILKILDSGLSIADVYEYLTKKYSNLSNMGAPNLYRYIKKIKKVEVGQAKPETEKTAEPIEPPKETEPVNLQDKFKEHLASVRGENSAEAIEQKPKDTRAGRNVLKPEKVDEWQEHRKKMGLPNTIDDEWRTKPTEAEEE